MEQHEEPQEDPQFVKVNVRPKTRRHLHELAQIEERPLHVVLDRAVMFYRRALAVASYDLPDPSRLPVEELADLTERSEK